MGKQFFAFLLMFCSVDSLAYAPQKENYLKLWQLCDHRTSRARIRTIKSNSKCQSDYFDPLNLKNNPTAYYKKLMSYRLQLIAVQ